jgi:hypothetical protein
MDRYGSAINAVVAVVKTTKATKRSDKLNIVYTRPVGASGIEGID